ncbi:hypothetical protein EYF80_022663 [Liparis tanakae]|uniref:Uncharacterized protein n=1 Tax=Liparis tanakae TaxID=230148 RepID=A0A4Z2HQ52_9TELE|nr:hypothetical protein EYF80_022663 [Liparis tanakae]
MILGGRAVTLCRRQRETKLLLPVFTVSPLIFMQLHCAASRGRHSSSSLQSPLREEDLYFQ